MRVSLEHSSRFRPTAHKPSRPYVPRKGVNLRVVASPNDATNSEPLHQRFLNTNSDNHIKNNINSPIMNPGMNSRPLPLLHHHHHHYQPPPDPPLLTPTPIPARGTSSGTTRLDILLVTLAMGAVLFLVPASLLCLYIAFDRRRCRRPQGLWCNPTGHVRDDDKECGASPWLSPPPPPSPSLPSPPHPSLKMPPPWCKESPSLWHLHHRHRCYQHHRRHLLAARMGGGSPDGWGSNMTWRARLREGAGEVAAAVRLRVAEWVGMVQMQMRMASEPPPAAREDDNIEGGFVGAADYLASGRASQVSGTGLVAVRKRQPWSASQHPGVDLERGGHEL